MYNYEARQHPGPAVSYEVYKQKCKNGINRIQKQVNALNIAQVHERTHKHTHMSPRTHTPTIKHADTTDAITLTHAHEHAHTRTRTRAQTPAHGHALAHTLTPYCTHLHTRPRATTPTRPPHADTHAHAHKHTRTHTLTHSHTHTHTNTHMHKHTHTRTHARTHAHTHTHTHTNIPLFEYLANCAARMLCPYVVFVLILYPSYRIMSHPPLGESGGVAIVGSVTVTAHSVIP